MKRYKNILNLALEHIRHNQSADGSFESISGTSNNEFKDGVKRHTTFFTANIALALQHAQTSVLSFLSPAGQIIAKNIEHNAIQFLLAQKKSTSSFNYWANDTAAPPAYPYPDDLDDTFTALSALIHHDRSLFDAQTLADIIHILIRAESHQGGPYRTWIVNNNAPLEWRDIDLAVNATVGYFLSLMGITVPGIEQLIKTSLENDSIASSYYPGFFPVAYFISRYYKFYNGDHGAYKETLARMIIKNIDDGHALVTPLERAMAITSLLNLGYAQKISPADIDIILKTIEHKEFEPHPFCIDPAINGKRSYGGSSSLTAAFCLEAIGSYMTFDYEDNQTTARHDDRIWQNEHIRMLAKSSCISLQEPLRSQALNAIEKITKSSITTLAYSFSDILLKKGYFIPGKIIEPLALANLYGWIAYDLYDDVIDGEIHVGVLPAANYFLRMLTVTYGVIEKDVHGSMDIFNEIMNLTEEANAWEEKRCLIHTTIEILTTYESPQFNDYKILADRSMGHAIGPLVMLRSIGCDSQSKEYQCVIWFFRHYLIARQLHDDAHDWVDDLMRGKINSASDLVMQRFRKKYPSESRDNLIIKLIPDFKKLFWEEIIDEISSLIHCHIALARKARNGSSIIAGTDLMEDILATLEKSARNTIKERNDIIAFLDRYNPNPDTGL